MAYIDDDGDVMIISTDQSAYCTFHESSLMLGTDKVKCQNALVGGGFGGKEDMTVQHLAALITYLTRRPVKVRLTRAESLLVHTPMRILRSKEGLIIPIIRRRAPSEALV